MSTSSRFLRALAAAGLATVLQRECGTVAAQQWRTEFAAYQWPHLAGYRPAPA